MSDDNGNNSNNNIPPSDASPPDDDANKDDKKPSFDDSKLTWFGDWSISLEQWEQDWEIEEEEAEETPPEPAAGGALGGGKFGGFGKFADFGEWSGLPEFWDPSEIPSWDEIEESARRKLLRLAARLNQVDQPVDEDFLREVSEVLQNFGYIPGMLPALFSFAEHFKESLQNAMQFDMWRSVLIALMTATLTQKDAYEDSASWLSYIGRELAIGDAFSKSTDDITALYEWMIKTAEESENPEQLILTRAAYLRAYGARSGPQGVAATTQELRELAKGNLYQQMHIHFAAGSAYNQLNDLTQAFIHGQQCFLIARQLGNKRQEMMGITLMTTLPLTQYQSTDLAKSLVTQWVRLPRHIRQTRLWLFMFYGQIIPYYCCVQPNHEKGVELCETALGLIEDRQVVTGRAEVLHGYGISLTYLGRYNEATEAFKQARGLYKYYQRPDYELAMEHAIAWVEVEKKNCKEALVALQAVRKAVEERLDKDDVMRKRLLRAIDADIEKCKKGLLGE